MTDHPASWLTDPTGRHDHRYWDGTRWTDHVADAGVAATDPYDGPADAVPDAPAPAAPSGWATTTEPSADEPAAATTEPAAADSGSTEDGTFSMSGWGDTADGATAVADGAGTPTDTSADEAPLASDETTSDATATATEAEAPASAWSTPTTATWGAPAATSASTPTWGAAPTDEGADEPAAVEDEASDDEEEETPAARWGAATTIGPSTTWEEPTTVAATPTPSPASTWGQPLPTEDLLPAPAPAGKSKSRWGLLLVIALGAIVGVVVALVVFGDDDEGGGGDTFAAQLSEQMQQSTSVSEEQADCVGDYVVDEIGESRIESVAQLQARSAPPELQEDFDRAVQRAITECDIDQADLVPPSGDTGGAGDGATATTAPQTQVRTEAQYKAYYQEALGLPEEDAACLAQHSAEAEESGSIDEGDGASQFYRWVDECGIDPDELFTSASTG
jgi:hypothetical protein